MISFLLDIRALFPVAAQIIEAHDNWEWVVEWMRGHNYEYRDLPDREEAMSDG
jgi:hypothetical protein